MKSITNPLHTTSYAVFGIYTYSYLLHINLSLKDMALIMGVDFISYFLIGATLDRFLFTRLFKRYQKVYPYFKGKDFLRLSQYDQVDTLQRLYELPFIRGLFTFFLSILKVLPCGIVLVYFIDHGLQPIQAWGYFISLEIFLIPLYSIFIFIELHIYLSKLISDLHSKHNLKDVFQSYRITRRIEYSIMSGRPSALFFVFIFISQIYLLSLHVYSGPLDPMSVIYTFLAEMIVFIQIYTLQQNNFAEGILNLQRIYYNMGSKKNPYVSLSSSPLLSQFQMAFNHLVTKLQNYEKGVLQWTLKESEESRFRALGEISAAIGHDLKGPINAIYFSLDELKKQNLSHNQNITKYFEYIEENTKRMEELSLSLNINLRNPDEKKYTHLHQIHEHVIGLLKYEFFHIEKVQFSLVHLEYSRKIKMSQRDLIHIFYNLYKNSLKNFQENQKRFPKITLKFIGHSEKFISFEFSDNGTGLSAEDFESFTSLNFDNLDSQSFKKGLGLRLLKQILANNHATLTYIKNPRQHGICFLLTLPHSQRKYPKTYESPLLIQRPSPAQPSLPSPSS